MNLRLAVDIAMLLTFLPLLSLRTTGILGHMALGCVLIVLVIIHQKLNFSWYRSLRRGRWTKSRIYIAIVNFLLLFSFLAAAITGLYILLIGFGLPTPPQILFRIHPVAGYLMLICTGLHMGLNWQAMGPRLKHLLHWPQGRTGQILSYGVIAVILAGGLYFTAFNAVFAHLTLNRAAIRTAYRYTSLPLFMMTSFLCVMAYAVISYGILRLLNRR